MDVFMTGGSGFVGSTLTARLTEEGHRVTVLSRGGAGELPEGASLLVGDPSRPGPWQDAVADHEVVINLAGASIFKRWTARHKQAILESRVDTTRNLVDALSRGAHRCRTLVSTSAVGYYGFHGDEELLESSPAGSDFLASVTTRWESEAAAAESVGVRVVCCRLGIVLGRRGGALGMMLPLFKRCLGSPLGTGTQWFSWIHEQDLVNSCLYVMEHERISGPVNCTAPVPVRNRELTRALGRALHRPVFLPPVPGVLLSLVMGEFGSVLLRGQRVIPGVLLAEGFEFRFSTLKEALDDILGRER